MSLIVPKVYQKDVNGCLPACIKMVLDYYIQTGKTFNIEELTIDDIRKKAKITKLENGEYSAWDFTDCDTFNNEFLSKHNLTLNINGNQTLKNIAKLIDADKPPILIYDVPAYLNGIGKKMQRQKEKHAQIVRDLNIKESQVLINDPDKILDSEPFDLSALIESWRSAGSILMWVDYPTRPITKQKPLNWFKGDKNVAK